MALGKFPKLLRVLHAIPSTGNQAQSPLPRLTGSPVTRSTTHHGSDILKLRQTAGRKIGSPHLAASAVQSRCHNRQNFIAFVGVPRETLAAARMSGSTGATGATAENVRAGDGETHSDARATAFADEQSVERVGFE